MRTLIAAVVAAVLAAAITATAANRGDPVYDKAAVKELHELNNNLADSRAEAQRGFDDLYKVIANSCRALADRSYFCPTPFR